MTKFPEECSKYNVAEVIEICENIKHVRDDGTEYWSARELAPILEYSKWENFHKVIKKAMISCENSGRSILDQFTEVRNLVEGGVAPSSKIDYIGSTELIANLFRISQTEEKHSTD